MLALVMRIDRRRRNRYLIVAEIVVVLVSASYLGWALAAGASQPAPMPGQPSGYIVDQARALGDDANRILAFVSHDVSADTSYEGVLRGAVGTLWAKSGDTDDRALLLQALLAAAGTHTQLVAGRDLGVMADTGSGLHFVGPGSAEEPGSRPVGGIPTGLEHMLSVTLVSTLGTGSTSERLAEIPTSSLTDQDLVLSYSRTSHGTLAVLSGPGTNHVSRVDASKATSEALTFAETGPSTATQSWQRELFTTEVSGYSSDFDPGNRYTIVVTTGWVPGYVETRETNLLHVAGSVRDAAAHAVAYDFLGSSDAERATLLKASGADTVDVDTPRITIVGDMAGGRAGRTMTLDLRADGLTATGPGRTAAVFETLHSLYDASLESTALGRGAGVAAISSFDELASALSTQGVQTPDGRDAVLSSALSQLLAGAQNPGDSLQASVEGRPDDWVRFTLSGSQLAASVSPAVAAALGRLGGPAKHLLPGSVTSGTVGQAAKATDAALVIASGAPLDYHEDVTFNAAQPAHLYDNSLLLFYSGNTLSFQEEASVAHDGGVTFNVTNYFDINGKPINPPQQATITVDAADASHSHDYTTYYQYPTDNATGRTWEMFSRDVFQELQTPSGAIVTFLNSDGTPEPPLRLWAFRKIKTEFVVNGLVRDETVLDVGGDYVSKHPTRPTTFKGMPNLVDKRGNNFNQWQVIDDPSFPYT
ncbi:MAG TPA: hypothetical protein VGS21_02105, partial [Acidimicrobiales bacterium]|nr:hypothetical protein [Acidimicrobiales bacterium]